MYIYKGHTLRHPRSPAVRLEDQESRILLELGPMAVQEVIHLADLLLNWAQDEGCLRPEKPHTPFRTEGKN